ncbi:MAG: hypothetical protein NC218_11015 [Acetobacter sp.]|nr:hypothetical protein [Acetobacter sp.]
MVQVAFPASPSSMTGENAIIRTYKFWETIKCFFTKRCYNYPVVYTDGLISYVVSDGKNRTPWGIAIGDYILALKAPEEPLTKEEANRYNKNVLFAGYEAENLDIEVLRYIFKNAGIFNRLLKKLGGTPLKNYDYLSSNLVGREKNGMMSLDYTKGRCHVESHFNNNGRFGIRPAINIANLYY